MNSSWSIEIIRLLVVIFSAIIVGVSSGYWLLSVSIHSLAYIIWLLLQIKEYQIWLSRGAHKKEAPDSTGIWQELVIQVYRSQSSHKNRKKALADMANYYHAVMRALPDATVVVNSQLEIEWANKATEKLLGIQPTKDVGQRFDNIVRIPDMKKLFDAEKSSKRIQIESPIQANTTLSLVRQEYDDNKHLIIAQDISQRIATQKLRKAFIANASHELRTPLTVISGYLELLTFDEDLPDTLKSVMEKAFVQASRMDTILDKLLILSKLEEKQYDKSSGEAIDVKSLLEEMVSSFTVSYTESKHEFKVIADDLDLLIVEDEFYSVCQNLVSNAVKYSPQGSKILIEWKLNQQGYACLSVTDQGIGIADEHINRITERFYRINTSESKISGTGLGLSIVKHILENFDGYLEIESIPDKGSTFSACFPSYRIIHKTK